MKSFIAFRLLLLFSVFFGFTACGEKEVQPKSGVVEYRLSSTSSLFAREVSYTNESGGVVTLKNVSLPFIVKVTPVEPSGLVYMVADLMETAAGESLSLTGTVLVDGEVIDTQTSTGAKPFVNISYVRSN